MPHGKSERPGKSLIRRIILCLCSSAASQVIPSIRFRRHYFNDLLAAATAGLATRFHLLPGGGDLLGTGVKLVLAVIANAFLGALMTLGIGLFAPCMMVTYLLGMNPKACFRS